jgi:hypothetical protein
MQEDHRVSPLDEGSSRQIWVGWGSAVVCLALAFLVGGIFVPYLLLFIGATMALRGHLPGLFAKHIDAQIIAGTPYRREESIKAWSTSVLVCILLAGASSWIHLKVAPQKPDLANTILEQVRKLYEQRQPAVTLKSSPAPAPLPKSPSVAPTIPKSKQLSIIFKNSPLFTSHRRDRIAARMESFYGYLGQLGLIAPKEVPPIGIGNSYGGAFTYPGPVYMDTVTIPEKAVDDPMAPVRAYAGYCFPVMMDAFNVNRADTFRRERASWIFQAYFVSSFSGQRPPPGTSQIDNWVGALWDIRQQYGQQFTDATIALSLKAFNDFGDVGGNSKLDLDTYFRSSFLAGESAVDNNYSNLQGVNDILKRHGFSPRQ